MRSVDQAEKNILSCLVEYPEKFLTITQDLPVNHFVENKLLAYAIYEGFKEWEDLTFRHVADAIGQEEAMELEGFIELGRVKADKEIVSKSFFRHLGNRLTDKLHNADGNQALMFRELRAAIAALEGKSEPDTKMSDVAAQLHSELIDGVEVETTPFGFSHMDRQLKGLQPYYYVLAARPSMGKTALSLQLAFNQALAGKQVVFASYEMDARSLAKRLQYLYSEVNAFEKIKDADKDKVLEAYKKIGKENITILTGRNYRSVDDLVKKIYYLHAQGKCDCLFVDYLQKLKGSGRGLREQVQNISGELQDLRVTLEMPVVALSQLSRSVESRNEHRPILSDLRESGDIEQDADIVLMLYRDEYYGGDPEINEVIVRKNRNGALGTIPMQFHNGLWHDQGYTPIIVDDKLNVKPSDDEPVPF